MLYQANRRALLAGLSSALFGICLDPALAAGKAKIKFDTDNDGTLDLKEVQAAAGGAFDKLDRDKDGTLDKKELAGRIAKSAMADADPDKDGTVTRTNISPTRKSCSSKPTLTTKARSTRRSCAPRPAGN